jgi:hypothetical protein
VLLNNSFCCASSWNTRVNANRSIARFRLSSVGGLIVMCVGCRPSPSSTVRKRGFAEWEGRRRRKTSKSALEGRAGGSIIASLARK